MTLRLLSLRFALGCATVLALSVAEARYDENDARRDCERKLRTDSRFKAMNDVRIEDQGNNSYRVKGMASLNGPDQPFNCRVRHGEVVSWNIEGSRNSSNNDDKAAAAVIIGAGLLGLAIAASQDKDDHDHNRNRDRYQNNYNDNALGDMDYLKKECRQNIRHHLADDHGRVNKLEFRHVDVHGRTLRGDGHVVFQNDEERNLSFSCDFDRRGQIVDGSYHYTRTGW